LHGDRCPSCGKRCLHPSRPEERKEHLEGCERRAKKLKQLQKSQEVECCVCLERVLSKPRIAERKFGILSGCDHAFCIACIRGWRSGDHTTPGMDLDTVVRSCPVCRVQSYFVTPSVVWYASPEEKDQILEGYKRKLKAIDCRHFNYGVGSCPFGTSCFYRHRFKDGREEEVVLRHLGTADGTVAIAKSVRLSDFIDLSALKKRR
jgi:E3 ubiquitin-protein ligase makorin